MSRKFYYGSPISNGISERWSHYSQYPIERLFCKECKLRGGKNYSYKGQGSVVLRLHEPSVRMDLKIITFEGKEQFYKLFIKLALKFLF